MKMFIALCFVVASSTMLYADTNRTVILPVEQEKVLDDVARDRNKTKDEVLNEEVSKMVDRMSRNMLDDQFETLRRVLLDMTPAERIQWIDAVKTKAGR